MVSILEALLSNGYLPNDVPPGFTSVTFGQKANAIGTAWASSAPSFTSSPEHYSLPRFGHRRRLLAWPNPVNEYMVAKVISDNWTDIEALYKRASLSISKPSFLPGSERAISFTPLRDVRAARLVRSAGYRYALATDISRFYSSLYTHAIPWAAHGKSKAKKKRKPWAGLWGNDLDLVLRNGNDRQTNGIPIGPDSSHIVAEIIGAAIDQAVMRSLKKVQGFRHMDDFYLCFDRIDDAQNALTTVIHALSSYGLSVNEEKTKILDLNDMDSENWSNHIDQAILANTVDKQKIDIERYFDLAYSYAKRFYDENVMKYAVRRSTRFVIFEDNWDLYESYLVRTSSVFPSTVKDMVEIVYTYNEMNYSIRRELFEKFINDMIVQHAPLHHHGEVAWVLWLARILKVSIAEGSARILSGLPNSLCAILCLDLRNDGLIPKGLDDSMWASMVTSEGLRTGAWLLSYEGGKRGWLKAKDKNLVVNDPLFSVLQKEGIDFYDGSLRSEPLVKRVGPLEPSDLFDDDEDHGDHEFRYLFSQLTEIYS